jgi:hypothetical protein
VADNTVQSGTDTIATDDLATLNGVASTGVKIQRVKPAFGVDGDARDVSAAFPMPVNLAASGGSGVQTTGSLTAAGAATLAGGVGTNTTSTVVVDVGNAGNISFHLLATAFVGTVVFEQTFDPAGTNGTWAPVPVLPEDSTSAPMNTLAISTAVAYVRQFTTGMFGPRLFRVRASVFTSGSLVVLASAGPGWVETQPALAPSSALIGAVDPACATTGTVTSATTSGTANTNTVAAAADTTRKGITVWNTHASAVLRIGYGTATTASLYSALVPANQGYEVPQAFAKLALNVSSATATVGYNLSVCV